MVEDPGSAQEWTALPGGYVADGAGVRYLDLSRPALEESPAPCRQRLRQGLLAMQARYPFLHTVAGNSQSVSVSVGVPGRGPDPYFASLIQAACRVHGLLIARSSHQLYLHLPPNLTGATAEDALARLEESFESLFET